MGPLIIRPHNAGGSLFIRGGRSKNRNSARLFLCLCLVYFYGRLWRRRTFRKKRGWYNVSRINGHERAALRDSCNIFHPQGRCKATMVWRQLPRCFAIHHSNYNRLKHCPPVRCCNSRSLVSRFPLSFLANSWHCSFKYNLNNQKTPIIGNRFRKIGSSRIETSSFL